jgi:hypothetical protein
MRGLDPRIHALVSSAGKDVDGRVKPGHDDADASLTLLDRSQAAKT